MDPDGTEAENASGPYRPIDCSLHDRLESLATLGTTCRIVIREGGTSRIVTDRITDVFTRGAEEFLTTPSTGPVRLDLVESVDPQGRTRLLGLEPPT
ncbi:MAG: hypothetical protein WEB90_05910 [Gemmatimonadota bacterium]